MEEEFVRIGKEGMTIHSTGGGKCIYVRATAVRQLEKRGLKWYDRADIKYTTKNGKECIVVKFKKNGAYKVWYPSWKTRAFEIRVPKEVLQHNSIEYLEFDPNVLDEFVIYLRGSLPSLERWAGMTQTFKFFSLEEMERILPETKKMPFYYRHGPTGRLVIPLSDRAIERIRKLILQLSN